MNGSTQSEQTLRLQSVTSVVSRSQTSGARNVGFQSTAGSPDKVGPRLMDSTANSQVMQISSLLRDAQSQVLELLPHKEENTRLQTELILLKERTRSKEEECRKLQHALNSERDDRHRVVKAVMEEGGAQTAAGEHRIRRLEEQLIEKKGEICALQRDFERKVAHNKSLEEDLAYCRQQRHEESQKGSQTSATLLQLQQRCNVLEKQVEELSRDKQHVDDLNKGLVTQLHDSENQLAAVRHDLDQVRKKRNDLSAEHAQLQGQLTAFQERVSDLEQSSSLVPQLRSENASLLSVRDELMETRRMLDSASSTGQAERSSRRVIESERDELRMRAEALAREVELLQTELHRARCDAAERLSLRTECDEARRALEAAYRASSECQQRLDDARRELMERNSDVEALTTLVTKELTMLRTTLESGVNSDEVLRTLNNQSTILRSCENSSVGLVADSSTTSRIQPVLWALQPLRRTIVEVNKSIEQDRLKHLGVSRMLDLERGKTLDLEDTLRTAHHEKSQFQLQLQETLGKLGEAQRELHHLRDTHRDLEGTMERRLVAIADSLRIEASSCGWDQIFTAVARTTQEAAASTAELQRLGEYSALLSRQLVASKHQNEVDRTELERESTRRMQELASSHLVAVSEANEEKSALREALKRETERHEHTAKELSTMRLNHQAALHAQATLQIQRDSLAHETDSLRKQLDHAHQLCTGEQKEKQSITEALQAETHRHSAAVAQLQDLLIDLARQKELTAQIHFVAMTLLRAVIWHREHTSVLMRERNFACQYSSVLEDAVLTAVKDKHIARPSASFRSAVIAVLAANRLVRLLAQQRATRRSLSPSRAPTRALSREAYFGLPEIQPIALPQLVSVVVADPTETVRRLEALAEVAQSPNKGLDFALYWKLCSRAKAAGYPALAKLTSSTIRRAKSDLIERHHLAKRLEGECEALRGVIQSKEEEIQSCNMQLARALAERTHLVDKRHVDHLQIELSQARSNLAREREEKRSAEEVAQHLRVREMELMSAQSELQSEARSLAIELAHRTASVDAVSSLRGKSSTKPAPVSRIENGSFMSESSSFASQYAPGERETSVTHVVGLSKRSSELHRGVGSERASAGYRSHKNDSPDENRHVSGSHNASAGDLFKMISEIDSRISDALRHS